MIKNILFFGFLVVFAFAKAQSPDARFLTKIQNATTAEINAITGAEEGMLVYDNEVEQLRQYDGTAWNVIEGKKNTVILNRQGGTLATPNNAFTDFPLSPANVQANVGTAFTVLANGHITINEAGQYLFSGATSTSNLPLGSHKYIIGLWINGTQVAYLSRGFVDIPTNPTDFWGTSGTVIYTANAGDDIAFRYVLNNNGNAVNAVFTNAAITKL
ncbi:hypothetical protein EAX61_15850 [Dokdonia sinensis]|uniref:Uncharacterized protein n=1 Tax=Dokdonia sinensis TaxID=2479847 RepID=A0A3M0FVW8_9FLAO|nr:hypothetical protein [Dokdonia sinensis]RMB56097.1 hypothetical protein EAX61_15850 [Dokdonia sinensis]